MKTKNKLVFDSDALIKLTKCGIIKEVLQSFNCFISREVYNEVVVQGKKEFFEDAFRIEELLNLKKLHIKTSRKRPQHSLLSKAPNLGQGEISTFQLFSSLKARAVITDDEAFLKWLDNNKLPFIIPTDLIVCLVKLRVIERKEGLIVLEKLRPYVKDSNYLKTKQNMEVT